MVRTRANPAAARKAVAAKAPRKSLPATRSSVASPTSSTKKRASGGNPMKMWPTPSWQKGLEAYFTGAGGSSSTSSAPGSSSSTPEEETLAGSSSSKTVVDTGGSSPGGIQLLSDDIAQLNSDSEED